MSKIQIMSEDLSNKIAAGEVVERISNVVKELVENSIDAGSTNIKVELINAGLKEIKVIDDGCGMDEVDASNAFFRHATSKIYKLEDLFFINTLGFRGEALPSIASVSKVQLQTSDGNAGTLINIEGGVVKAKEKCDLRKGTIIKVNDLFYNTPARLKYLKSENSELANTTSFMERLALSYPSISFTLINNGNVIVKTSGSNNLLKTIHEVFGLEISKNMIEVRNSNDDYDLYGYVCKPVVLKSNRNYMITIVNGRVVKNAELNRCINDAYYTYKPDIKYPVVVLEINTDPTLIDVNIHPTKQDIKFSKIDALKDLVLKTIKDALYNSLLIPKVEVKSLSSDNNEIPIKKEYVLPQENNLQINDDFDITNFKPKEEIIQDTFDFKLNEKNEQIKALELYPCGLVMGTYIVAQNNDCMYLIDQHAAQERINYEKILKSLKEDKVMVTDLLIPINIELSPSDYLQFKEHFDIFTHLGFKIDEFGINTIIIKAHPTWLVSGYEEENIRRIIEYVITLNKDFDRFKFKDHIAATCACKLSVKGNTNITMEQASSLLNDLVKCDNPYNCPHGRPAIISFTRYELEKMFKRVMN
jgi:DNA mismatch repair protein MutL